MPQRAAYWWTAWDVRDYELQALRRRIGVVPQKAVLFSGTIRDNLRWERKTLRMQSFWRPLGRPRDWKLWKRKRTALMKKFCREDAICPAARDSGLP